ncbi:hypothetical protein C2W62_34610 [Candidatus Entotheonella serta]|nr:hypothetical protein C2W62_34610 [Candidatus Entotheonella serta]
MATKKRKKQRKPRVKSLSSAARTRPDSTNLTYSEYEITDEPMENWNLKRLPAEVRDTIDDLYEQVYQSPKDVLPELECRVVTYPEVPLFANHLTIAYGRAGKTEKAEALVVETYQRHPQYLFAKVNYAQICLSKGEVSKVPGIFNHKFDIKALYPRRKRFHIDEFVGFTGVMFNYHFAIGQTNTALHYYHMLRQVAPSHPLTKQAKRSLYPPFWLRWLLKLAGKKRLQSIGRTEWRNFT